MKSKSILATILACCFLLSNCASFLNGRYQKVSFYSNTPNSKLSIDDKPVGTGKLITTKVRRDMKVKQLRLEAPGYKPEYKIFMQTKKSPLLIMSWIPFGILFLMPPIADRGTKSKNYEREVVFNPKVKISPRQPNQKYIYLENTSFDVKKEDLIFESYSYGRFEKNKESRSVKTSEQEIDISNSIFTSALNDILKQNGFVDTTKSVFRNKSNTMLINAKVSKIKFKRIFSKFIATGQYLNSYCVADISVDWELRDIYGEPKFTQKITSTSGEFSSNVDYSAGSSSYEKGFVVTSVQDALTGSFFQFLSNQGVKDLINIDLSKKLNFPPITLATNNNQQTLKSAQLATVTISTKKGHGSGCLLSKDGYIITNYHVIAGNGVEKIEVILNTGDKYKATVIRSNEDSDLTLLKIDNAQDLNYFALPPEKNFEIGDEVFAIGTPESIELSQTLSKGIISGFRKVSNSSQFIQTDVSVNPGNSGGALVNKQGYLLGIVNSKLYGLGVEGISFCIPAYEISKMLNLQ